MKVAITQIMKKIKYRRPVLKLVKRLGITENVYKLLWKEKRKQKKSMARIVNDIIIKEYGEIEN